MRYISHVTLLILTIIKLYLTSAGKEIIVVARVYNMKIAIAILVVVFFLHFYNMVLLSMHVMVFLGYDIHG